MTGEVVLRTARLLLRPWRVSEAGIQRALWLERDPRVPPHRRVGADGRPTVEELAERIRLQRTGLPGLLAAELTSSGDVIGYCGLIETGYAKPDEPELAYEFFRRNWGQGYATEAARAVVAWAQGSGYRRLRASVRVWNAASQAVLAKTGFVVERTERDEAHGDNLITMRDL